jgi:hypothetical protein
LKRLAYPTDEGDLYAAKRYEALMLGFLNLVHFVE